MEDASIQFLHRFLTWLQEWKALGEKGLSKETFQCAMQTTEAMPLMAEYVLQQKDFENILLGKVSSDAIEKRFGQYRQLAGSNYYVCVCQFVEDEKSI